MLKFLEPLTPEEENERFVLIETRGDRVLVELVCDMAIRPQFVYLTADLVPCEC